MLIIDCFLLAVIFTGIVAVSVGLNHVAQCIIKAWNCKN
jgi:hypothetical protein